MADWFLRLWCFLGFHVWIDSYESVKFWERQKWRCCVCGALKVQP